MTQRWMSVVIVAVVVSAWCYLLFKSDNDPEALRRLVGCYRHTDATLPQTIRVESDGRFTGESFATHVTGYSNKGGICLLPAQKVVVVQGHFDKVKIDRGYPLLIRASADRRTLEIPSETRGSAIYARVRC